MFKLLDTVVLTRDVPDAGLRRGDLGAIVEVYGPNAFEVEFVAASGRTQALVTLAADDLRHVDDHDLISVRALEQAAGQALTATNVVCRKLETAEWGDGVVDAPDRHLARSQPGLSGFNRRHLFRMRQFCETCRDDQKAPPQVTELPWNQPTRNSCRFAARGPQ